MPINSPGVRDWGFETCDAIRPALINASQDGVEIGQLTGIGCLVTVVRLHAVIAIPGHCSRGYKRSKLIPRVGKERKENAARAH